jgi:hypothetical protein
MPPPDFGTSGFSYDSNISPLKDLEMTSTNTALALTDTSEELARWNSLLEQIAAGKKLEDALMKCGVTSKELTLLTLNPLEAQRWNDARFMAKRRRWPQLEIDEILSRLAAGKEVEQALIEVRGNSDDAGEFYELLDAPDLSDRYAAAQRANALRSAASLTAIADDDSKDTLDTLKGPIPSMAAVGRSKLRIETRQWLNGAWHERFSDKKGTVNVQVNIDHAETLEAARTRERVRDKGVPKINQQVIDAAFSPVEENRRALAAGAATADRMRTETTSAEPEPVTAEQPAAEVKDLWGFYE